MTSLRPWLLLFVAGFLFEGFALAQDNAGGGAAASPAQAPAAGGTGAGGNGSGNAPSAPAAPANPNQGATGAGVTPPPGTNGTTTVPSFRTGPASTLPGTTPDQSANGESGANAAGGSASSFGSETGSPQTQLRQAPASFTVPGFYGRGTQQFTVGEGRLARPRFRFTGNISVGYDDNVFQTPTHPASVPAQEVQVPVSAAVPATTQQVVVPSGDPNIPSSVETVPVPAVPAKFMTIKVPGEPAPQRLGTFVTRTDAKWDVQMANRRTLFTFDLGGGVDYYWDRPGKKEDYTGNVSLVYLRKLTGRAQFTISLDSSYQSQPDFSQPNLPTSNNVGSYLSSNLKADLSYRLTPRFSSVTSVSYNALSYVESTQSNSNYASTTFGTELRYLFSPRLTLLGELRYSSDMHANDASLNTTSYYLIAGGELTLSRRFTSSLRLGEVVQSFSDTGTKNSSPYVEATLAYRLAAGTTIQWNGRYGYEESGSATATNIVARSGLQLTQIFSPRFQASLSVNLLRSDSKTISIAPESTSTTPASTSTSTSSTSKSTASTAASTTPAATTPASSSSSAATPASTTVLPGLTPDQVQDTLDATLGFYYTLDRHWSFNLTYSYTTVIGPQSTADFYHQRLFLGASYQF